MSTFGQDVDEETRTVKKNGQTITQKIVNDKSKTEDFSDIPQISTPEQQQQLQAEQDSRANRSWFEKQKADDASLLSIIPKTESYFEDVGAADGFVDTALEVVKPLAYLPPHLGGIGALPAAIPGLSKLAAPVIKGVDGLSDAAGRTETGAKIVNKAGELGNKLSKTFDSAGNWIKNPAAGANKAINQLDTLKTVAKTTKVSRTNIQKALNVAVKNANKAEKALKIAQKGGDAKLIKKAEKTVKNTSSSVEKTTKRLEKAEKKFNDATKKVNEQVTFANSTNATTLADGGSAWSNGGRAMGAYWSAEAGYHTFKALSDNWDSLDENGKEQGVLSFLADQTADAASWVLDHPSTAIAAYMLHKLKLVKLPEKGKLAEILKKLQNNVRKGMENPWAQVATVASFDMVNPNAKISNAFDSGDSLNTPSVATPYSFKEHDEAIARLNKDQQGSTILGAIGRDPSVAQQVLGNKERIIKDYGQSFARDLFIAATGFLASGGNVGSAVGAVGSESSRQAALAEKEADRQAETKKVMLKSLLDNAAYMSQGSYIASLQAMGVQGAELNQYLSLYSGARGKGKYDANKGKSKDILSASKELNIRYARGDEQFKAADSAGIAQLKEFIRTNNEDLTDPAIFNQTEMALGDWRKANEALQADGSWFNGTVKNISPVVFYQNRKGFIGASGQRDVIPSNKDTIIAQKANVALSYAANSGAIGDVESFQQSTRDTWEKQHRGKGGTFSEDGTYFKFLSEHVGNQIKLQNLQK